MSYIFITGGAGYIGCHVVKELTKKGYKVIVYDNLQTGHLKAVQGAKFILGDLSDPYKLRDIFRNYHISAVMHFAADSLVSESVEKPLKYFINNVKNSLNLLEIMEEFKINKFVFSSSAAVYGEPRDIPITEEHPCNPNNPYGETKWIFEKVLEYFHQGKNLDYISLRYFNAAGADPEGELGEDHNPETHLIPICLKAALEGKTIPIYGTDYDTIDGTCIRDYIHVTDLAYAHILALEKLGDKGISQIYNLGNGNGYSVKEVIETVRKVTDKKIDFIERPRRQGDPARLVASSKKIKEELGWCPKFPSLDVIIETAWKWHKNHPNGYNDLN